MISKILKDHCLAELQQKSRIHELRGYFNHSSKLFVKRDDELGLGIGGTKTRKYVSLVKSILDDNYQNIIIEGSLNSNNVLGLVPLLKSYGMSIKVAVPKAHTTHIGNAQWLNTLLRPTDFIEIESTNGLSKQEYTQLLGTDQFYVVKEGACQIDAIAGLLSLSIEINDFEKKHNLSFDKIFIDAGTGITAIALLIGAKLLKTNVELIITQIAGNEVYFIQTLQRILGEFNAKFHADIEIERTDFKLLKPITSKSFGSINQTLKKEWITMMEELYFPLDMTYTAKHFFTVKNYLQDGGKGLSLIINSGSWLAARNHEHLVS